MDSFTQQASLVAQSVKRLPAMQQIPVRSLVREDPLEKEMATHSSTLAWRIPWMEEPGRLQSMGSQRVGHDWETSLSFFMLFTDWYTHHWNHSEIVIHFCWNISSILYQFSLKENWYVIFFFIDMKMKQEGKDERNRCYLNSSGAICLFWSLYQQLPHHGDNPVPSRLHGFPCSQDTHNGPHSFSCHCNNTDCYCQGGFQSLYKYTSLGDPYLYHPRIGLPFQYH